MLWHWAKESATRREPVTLTQVAPVTVLSDYEIDISTSGLSLVRVVWGLREVARQTEPDSRDMTLQEVEYRLRHNGMGPLWKLVHELSEPRLNIWFFETTIYPSKFDEYYQPRIGVTALDVITYLRDQRGNGEEFVSIIDLNTPSPTINSKKGESRKKQTRLLERRTLRQRHWVLR